MQNTFIGSRLRSSVYAVVSCLALSSLPLAAQAAGLGKITVFSALGQPLRGEVELSATREELSGMKAQLASQDAFRLAGLDYVTTLSGIRFAIDLRANGQPVIKLSSDKPIIDPFVDMLLELNWPTGRLVREYTFLLDPPELASKPPVIESPAAYRYTEKYTEPSKPTPEVPVASNPIPAPTPASPSPQEVPPLRVQTEAKAPLRSEDSHQIKRGETLAKIASESKPEGVSLEQMLVGMFRANPNAFDGNMNRMKTGRILSVPDKSGIETVSQGEAKKIVFAQSSDWNAYRRKLASAAAQAPNKEKEADGKREAAGKVTPKVEDKAAPAVEPKDQLRVSKAEAAAAKRSVEDLIASEKSLREANDRVSGLEKNVSDLQKLVELKNQNLAALQKQLIAKAAPVEAAKPEPVVKAPPVPPMAPPVEPKKPEAAIKPPPAPLPEPAPVVAATPPVVEKPLEKVVEVAPPEPPANLPVEAATETKPEEKPVEPPPPKQEEIAPPPPEEPDFVEELIDSPMALVGGGGILALLAAYFLVKRRRNKAEEAPAVKSALATRSSLVGKSTLAPQGGSSTPSSVFRSTGGQSIDTSYVPAPSDFSQAGTGTIDTDEVDPVAEADVYMAYGRDVQAEEILLEAKQKDPKRHAIHLKLLEIYSNRKNTKQFETLATDFYAETGGQGSEWEKAAAMGLKLDPLNPLFGGSGQPAEPEVSTPTPAPTPTPTPAPTPTPTPAPTPAPTPTPTPAPTPTPTPTPTPQPTPAPTSTPAPTPTPTPTTPPLPTLEFNVEELAIEPLAAPVKEKPPALLTQSELDAAPLDFDLSDSVFTIETSAPEVKLEPESNAELERFDAALSGLNFALPEDTHTEVAKAVPEHEQSEPEADIDFDLEFDVKMTESTVLGQPMQSPSFDMTAINLDLDDFAQNEAAKPKQVPAAQVLALDAAQMDQIDFTTEPFEMIEKSEITARPQPIPQLDLPSSEEVATKLDLANAYEEMGDLEGVRELLQEVLKEGDAIQREKAQAILTRID